MNNRGAYTEEIKNKYDITVTELRLIPYLQYLIVNRYPVSPEKITTEEREVLKKWRDEGKITFSTQITCSCTKEFWDFMNEVLWDSYAAQLKDKES